MLCSAPILCYPKFDREFILQTDASDFGVGAILSQIDDDGLEKVVAYASKALSARQKKFSTTEKEAYAIIFGTTQFRVYLLGRHFKIVTDHSALRWLHSMEPKGRLARWIMDLQEFEFSVVHRAGRLHNNADALSRLVQSPPDIPVQCNATERKPCEDSQGVSIPLAPNIAPVANVTRTEIRVKLSGGPTAIITLVIIKHR